jgi:hypothetical protein
MLFASAVGCAAQGDEVIQILQNQAPEDGCEVPGSPTSTYIGSGIIDTGASLGYLLHPVVKNNASSQGGTRTAQRTVVVQGASVSIDFVDITLFSDAETLALDAAGFLGFRVPTTVSILPDGATAALRAEIVAPGLLDALAAKLAPGQSTLLSTTTTVYGEMSGGSVESQPFGYSIEVCNGCMRRDLGACSSVPSGYEASPGGQCNLLQDIALDCCTNSSGAQICPAAYEAPEV